MAWKITFRLKIRFCSKVYECLCGNFQILCASRNRIWTSKVQANWKKTPCGEKICFKNYSRELQKVNRKISFKLIDKGGIGHNIRYIYGVCIHIYIFWYIANLQLRYEVVVRVAMKVTMYANKFMWKSIHWAPNVISL